MVFSISRPVLKNSSCFSSTFRSRSSLLCASSLFPVLAMGLSSTGGVNGRDIHKSSAFSPEFYIDKSSALSPEWSIDKSMMLEAWSGDDMLVISILGSPLAVSKFPIDLRRGLLDSANTFLYDEYMSLIVASED